MNIMADETKNNGFVPFLFGRKPIYTSIERFDPDFPEEIISEVTSALVIHNENMLAMEYLYWYRRGITPVNEREKEIRPEINNKINVAYADEICTFKNGYFLTDNTTYIAREDDTEISDKVKTFNEYVYRSGKHLADNKVVNWFHTVGKADLFVRSNDDPDVPFKAYALDPRCAFVAVSSDPSARPVYGGYMVKDGDEIRVSLWDDTNVYTLVGAKTGQYATPDKEVAFSVSAVIDRQPNPLGRVPIIEYY